MTIGVTTLFSIVNQCQHLRVSNSDTEIYHRKGKTMQSRRSVCAVLALKVTLASTLSMCFITSTHAQQYDSYCAPGKSYSASGGSAGNYWGVTTNFQCSNNGFTGKSKVSGTITDLKNDGLYVYWKGRQFTNCWNNKGIDGSRPAAIGTPSSKSIDVPYLIYGARMYRSDGQFATLFINPFPSTSCN